MISASLLLIITAAILIGIAIELLLKNAGRQNLFGALTITILALVVGLEGVGQYLVFFNLSKWIAPIDILKDAFLAVLAPTFFHFAVYFPRTEKSVSQSKWIAVFYVTAAILTAVSVIARAVSGSHPVDEIFGWINSGFAYIGILSICGFVFRKKAQVGLVYQKKQIRYFVFSTLLLVFAHIAALILSGILPWISGWIVAISSLAYGAFFLYVLISYRFTSIRAVGIRAVKEIAIAAVFSAPITILLFLLLDWAGLLPMELYFAISLPAIAILMRLFVPWYKLNGKILGIAPSSIDITEAFFDRMVPCLDIRELAIQSSEALLLLVHSRRVDFLGYNDKEEVYEVIYSTNRADYKIPAINPFFRHIQPETDIYDRELINIDPKFAGIREMAEKYFTDYDTAVLIPFFYEKELPVIVHLSGLQSGNSYTMQEVLLLKKFRKVMEIVLKNIILYAKQEHAKINDRDIMLASDIQNSVCQQTIPSFQYIDIYGYEKPAAQVNGDYYLVEKISDDEIGVLIADVSGKGVPAALIAMVIHTIAKSQEFSATTTNAIVAKINEVITFNQSMEGITRITSFATVFCGFIDYKEKVIYYTNAGHLPAIIFDRDTGKTVYLPSNAKPVGIFQDSDYPSSSFYFQQHQVMALYSDGITEATNEEYEEFGQERLEAIIRENSHKPSKEIAGIVIQAVNEFSASKEQFDDITLIVIKF